MSRIYDVWLRNLAADSGHPFVRDSEAMIQYLFELDRDTPSKYRWRVTSAEAFKEQLSTSKAANDLNRLYWHDMARNIEAYDIMVVWRATELIKPALRSLNTREILAPAVLSRSLLELAASVIINSNTIYNTVENAVVSAHGKIVYSEELEKYIVRMIHGTRIGEPPDYLKQVNALTYIQRVSKNQNASELWEIYEHLCDVTHPNVLGNARFWATIEAKNKDGSETLRMERHAESITTTEILEKILWVLGWSAACVRNGVEISQDAVRVIMERWPK